MNATMTEIIEKVNSLIFSLEGLQILCSVLAVTSALVAVLINFIKHWKYLKSKKRFIERTVVSEENKTSKKRDNLSSKEWRSIYKQVISINRRLVKTFSPKSKSTSFIGDQLLSTIVTGITNVSSVATFAFLPIEVNKAIAHLLLESKMDRSKKKSNTIVGLMLAERSKKYLSTTYLLLLSLAIQTIFTLVGITTMNWFIFWLILFSICALHFDQYLIAHRVRRGWYGRNEYEAREIISFVMSHADKNDFNNSGGLKKLMDTPEAEKPTQIEGAVIKA
jgi:hypothetical protein